MDFVRQLLHDYLLLFAMVNAVGNLPLFADLTSAMTKTEQTRTYKIAVLTGGIIVLGFALFGDVMLRNVFNVSLPAFKIAGGILVFIVAARGVIMGSQSAFSPVQSSQSVAVFPMGFPFLAGPGTILTTILLIQGDGHVITVITVFLVYLTVFPILKLAPYVEKIVGKIGVLVISRILYIFICAKAASFILDGLHIKL